MTVARSKIEAWLTAYGAAWTGQDAEAAAALFVPEAVYLETPFEPPLIGTDAIRRYWQLGAVESQRDIIFEAALVSLEGTVAIAHWRAGFTRVDGGERVRLDGIFRLTFDADVSPPKCARLEEWWHRTSAPAG